MTKIELRYSEESGYYVLMYRDDKLIKKAIGDDFTYNIKKLSSFDKILKNADISNDVFKAELYDGVIDFYNLEKYDELLTKYFPKSYTYAKTKLMSEQKKAETKKIKELAKEISEKENTRKKLIKESEKEDKRLLREEAKQKAAISAEIKKYQREKKAELRLRKIEKANKVATIAGTIVVCASLITSIYFLGYKEVIYKINKYADENNKIQTEESINNISYESATIKDVDIHNINIVVLTSEEKINDYLLAEEKYGDIISELSEKYGIDSSILTAICASNINNKDGLINSSGRIGPMNISYYDLEGREFRVYNFKQKKWEIIEVKQEKLKDDYQNISIGCAILQMAYRDANGNIVAALEGCGLGSLDFNKFKDKLSGYTRNTSLKLDTVLTDKDNYNWFNEMFSDIDNTYFGKIASYLPTDKILMMRYVKYYGYISTDFYIINKPIEKEFQNRY